ncbi:MAG TPA: L,D-transpeptidase family protein [Ruminiclostridium sp.]|nr:L,D-transpeptidase family protein [Ruminiclostridium sp.]
MRKSNNNFFYIIVVALISSVVILTTHTVSLYFVSNTKIPVPKKNYSILIDLEEKNLYLLDSGKLVKKYPCAIGKSSTPSPIGSFKITGKSKWGEGFGGYWLGINCPWGKFGIHGTIFPETIGTEASHGCFRMYNKDIKELYSLVSVGTPVCISGGCYGAFGQGNRIIEPYMYGRDVQVVQLRLNELGYYKGSCNGKYNTETMKVAVHKFQRDNGLTVSDNINQETLNAMNFVLME